MYNVLAQYRLYSKKYGVPFWRMLQAGGQWNDELQWIESKDPYPSEGELLYDVNMALCYGAKAIQYFPLIQPFHFSYEKGGTYDFTNRNGLIGADGNLTRWYYYAKRANTQVQAVDEYLMHSSSEKILVHGDKAIEAIITAGKPTDDIVAAGDYRQLKSVSGDDAIVGCFNYKGKTALYVVNYSRTEKANVNLSFDKNNYRYTVIQRGETADVVGGQIPLTLDAGEGALIVPGQPETGLGITPGFGGTQRLARLVSPGMAKQLIYTAKNIKADEAYRIGLVNAVYPLDELLPAAEKLAETIAKNAPIAVRACKQAINEGLQVDMDKAIVIEEKLFGSCFQSADQIEGMSAFLEKRKHEPYQNK